MSHSPESSVDSSDSSLGANHTCESPSKQLKHQTAIKAVATKRKETNTMSSDPRKDAPLRPSASTTLNARSEAPEFGKTSPLRNPLQKDNYSKLFNVPKPGQPRAEHHRAHLPIHRAPQTPESPFAPESSSTPWNQAPPRPLVDAPSLSWNAMKFPDVMEIPRPASFPIAPKTKPVPISRPTNPQQYDSIRFMPIHPVPTSSQARVDLADRDDDDGFDPNAALKDDRFGAPDPLMYVDAAKANDDLKNLLEGAFENDEDDQPKMRLRKRNHKCKKSDALGSLAGKLEALKVQEESQKTEAEDEVEEEEEDDGTVEGLKIKLLPHQVEGVTWMLDKEIGVRKKNGVLPKGGILADDMGLGKTIQTLALIMQNPRPSEEEPSKDPKRKISESVSKCTLVVAPLALIKQWESEIKTKVLPGHELRVLVHHGPSRTKRAADLKKYDIVITTYQIMASEHANSDADGKGIQTGCFGVHWYRIILDEAHTIKNRNAKMTQACCALRSHYRWCLTGTPMQNHPDELQSLIRFLQIKPYSEMSAWKTQITGPLKNGRGGLAMKRLQFFLKAFMKRRTKDILKAEGALNPGGKPKEGEGKPAFKIVDRKVETVVCELNDDERRFYNRLADRAESRFKEMMGAEKQDYIGALVLLLRLRQACNHPELMTYSLKKDKDALTTGSKTETRLTQESTKDDLDELTMMLGGLAVGTKQCDVCQVDLSKEESSSGAVRCSDCESDLKAQRRQHKNKKRHSKKAQRSTMKPARDGGNGTDDDDEEAGPGTKNPGARPSRRRRVVIDSDDEEEGEWIVPEDSRKETNLGKAGGTDDEDAEGGGDTLGSVDSKSDDSDEEDDSFISHDSENASDAEIGDEDEASRNGSSIADDDSSVTDDSDDSVSGSTESVVGFHGKKKMMHIEASSKIRKLLEILHTESPSHKIIVFSQFTSMLDLIEPFLRREKFNFVRYDGSMPNLMREASLEKLRNDKRTRVLLCSLKCGSLGLNLTAASRVVIIEPFWNPFVEEQAIDRVHRLNQTVDVIVYRLTVDNTVEERILELQAAKRKMAAAAIEGGSKKGINKLDMKDIMNLFRHDAHHDASHEDQKNQFLQTKVLSQVESGVLSKEYGSSIREITPPRQDASREKGKKREEHPIWGRR